MFVQPMPQTPPIDHLIAAGSTISFRDIYDKQMDLTIHRKKYYKAEEVDRLLVLMNGILTNVSSNQHRQTVAMSELREEIQQLQQRLSDKDAEIQAFSQSNIESAQLIHALRGQTQQQASVLNEQQREIEQLKLERLALAKHITEMKGAIG